MKKRKSKHAAAGGSQSIVDADNVREYQETEFFKQKFQRSEVCYLCREPWGVPPNGFKDSDEYVKFHNALREKDATYVKTDRFKKRAATLAQKRKARATGKISKAELESAELTLALSIPSVKYDFDIDQAVLKSKKPWYWRGFIEECILLEHPSPQIVRRPLPNPVLVRDELGRYEVKIENIFSDTTINDFNNAEFTQKLRGLQEKLPGYGPTPRTKRSFKIGRKILELDKNSRSRDLEKVIAIEELVKKSLRNPQKKKYLIKQIRHRMKKRYGIL